MAAWPKAVFEILIMVGVAGELLGDGGVFLFSRQLQILEGDDIKTLDTKTRSALDRAGTADTKAQSAFNMADKAQGKTDAVAKQADALGIRMNNTSRQLGKLEGESLLLRRQILFQEPRSDLLFAHAHPFVEAMRQFVGQKIEIRLNLLTIQDPKDAEETRLFASMIQFLLGTVSGWSISGAQGDMGWGVTVVVSRKSSPNTRNAAAALVSALADCGLTDMNRRRPVLGIAQAGSVIDRENTPPETILLYVGRHP